MAVAVTKGDHTVEMLPHSLYLKKASMVTLPLAALLIIYWSTVFAIRRKIRKETQPAA
jgi:hypothetical protein